MKQWIRRIWDAILGRAITRPTKDEIHKLTGLPSKLSDADIKRLAHNVLDSTRDANELATRVLRHPLFIFFTILAFILIFFLGYITLWTKLATTIETKNGELTKQLTTNVQAKLDASYTRLTNDIEEKLQAEKYLSLVREVVTNRANELLLTQIQPTIDKFTNSFNDLQTTINNLQAREDELSNSINLKITTLDSSLKHSEEIDTSLQVVMSNASLTLQRLDQDSIFVTTAISADHDDRSAYEQLMQWAHDTNFSHQVSASSIVQSINLNYSGLPTSWWQAPWDIIPDGTNHYSWDITHINIVWNNLIIARNAKAYVDFVWENTNLVQEQRLSFLRNVYLTDSRNSLQAANASTQYASQALHVNYFSPFDHTKAEAAWSQYSKTNHLFTLPANESTNIAYDILPPSSERVFALNEIQGGPPNYPLVQLTYPAVPKSISVKVMDYSDSTLGDFLKIEGSHNNYVWGHFFRRWNPNAVKFEFRYEKDFSTTNVLSAKINTNSVVLDSFRVPLPTDP
jgi:predicted transposase YbfD/YdcC